ncbi:MAG: Uma2 family endonuclease [Planctomycetes bacterium]|nr:Uma2 family endonuclease [Planctomycetota bacterium]
MPRAPARPLHVLGVEVPARAHTLGGFRAWVASLPDSGPRPRATFCSGGVYVEMSPQDYDSHAPLVAEVNRVLGTLAVDGELGMYFKPPSWFTHARAGLSTEPDGMLVRYESFRSGRARINPRRRSELLGAPDMALEVVSSSNPAKDLVDFVRDYARAGIAEYWLVDAREGGLDFQLLVLDGRRYRLARRDRQGWVRSPVFDRRFRLRRVTNAAGLAEFRLDVRRA